MKNDIKSNEDLHSDNIPSIRFKRKRAKSNIILFFRSVSLFLIAGIVGALFASILVELKYDKLNKALKESNDIIFDYSGVIDSVKESIVTIASDKNYLSENRYIEGNATGVIIEDTGRILTSYSKVKDMSDIYVKLSGITLEAIKADIIVSNEDADIAILQLDYNGKLEAIKFASKDESVVGQRVALISNSSGDEYIDNIIPGIITSTNRSIKVNGEKYSLIETNTPISEVNTGGIICNMKGELIGIASEKVNNLMDKRGVYYIADFTSLEEVVTSANEIKDILGIIEGGFIGDEGVEDVVGLYVARIKKDSSSYRAGLRPTDIIIDIDGYDIKEINEVYKILDEKNKNDILNCKVMRAGKVTELQIQLDNIKK